MTLFQKWWLKAFASLAFVGLLVTQFQNCSPVGSSGADSPSAAAEVDPCLGVVAPTVTSSFANRTAKSGLGEDAGTVFPENIPVNVARSHSRQAYNLICTARGINGIDVDCGDMDIQFDTNNTECVSGSVTISVQAEDSLCRVRSAAKSFVVQVSNACPSQQKVISSDVNRLDNFGSDVAIDGSRAVVLAPRDDEKASNAGAAYAYEMVSGSWVLKQKLIPATAGVSTEPNSVAIAGDYILIGAPWHNDHGAVFVYKFVNGSWVEQAPLLPNPTNASADLETEFGYDVAISGSLIAVGAPGFDGNGKAASGSVRFYKISNGAISTPANNNLLASDGVSGDSLGMSVAVSGNRIAAGAPASTAFNVASYRGKAYVFDVTSAPVEVKLDAGATDAPLGSRYGYSIDIDGDRVVVGATNANTNRGAVFYFTITNNTPVKVQRINGVDTDNNGLFGHAIALKSGNLVIGAPANSVGNDTRSGRLYFYNFVAATNFTFKSMLYPRRADRGAEDKFAESVDISSDLVIAGSRLDDEGAEIEAGSLFVIGFPQ